MRMSIFFMCLFAICIFTLKKYLFTSYAQFWMVFSLLIIELWEVVLVSGHRSFLSLVIHIHFLLVCGMSFHFLFFFFFLLFLWAAPTAYGGSQARGRIGRSCSRQPTPQPQQHGIRTASATYTTAHGNARSLTHCARPGIEPATSWFLVGFVNHCAMTGTLLFTFLTMFSEEHTFLILMKSILLIVFLLRFLLFCLMMKIFAKNQGIDIFPVFSLGFTLRSRTHLDLIFVYSASWVL